MPRNDVQQMLDNLLNGKHLATAVHNGTFASGMIGNLLPGFHWPAIRQ
jgi:hypothetical protein